MMETIVSLRPRMSREELFREVLPRGIPGRLRHFVSPVRGVAELYLPFVMFSVEIANAGRRQTRQFAIDAVTSTLDLYEVESSELSEIAVSERNVVAASRCEEECGRALIDKVRRLVFRTGFFALREVEVIATPLRSIHVPYWVVMVGAEHDLRLRVFDAARGRPEGAKVRSLVRQWLTAA